MTNEEITKDLTVALVSRMTDPTPDTVFAAYNEILQKIGESRQAVTLQTIQEHLTKQDQAATNIAWNTGWLALIAFAGSICVAGMTLLATQTSTSWGWGLIIYGALLLFVFWGLAAISKQIQKRNHRP